MAIRPTVLPVREGHGIHATAPGHERDLAVSAQVVNGEKHLVPRQISALMRDLFEVAGMSFVHDVDHLIFHGRVL